MSGVKKNSAAKIAAMVFCLAAAAVLVILIVVKIYIGGQIKTINSVYTALSRDIYSDYKDCFASTSEQLSEKEFEQLFNDYEEKWGEDFHFSTDFISREKNKNGYKVTFKLTVYNETNHENSRVSFQMVRQSGKWVINES